MKNHLFGSKRSARRYRGYCTGRESNIQDLSIIHADPGAPAFIGDRVTVGHRCIIHGCMIEDNCLIGMGAIIMNRSKIGKGSIIAAGSVILENTVLHSPYSLVAGIPGVVKRTLGPDSEKQIIMGALHYVEKAAQYASGLVEIGAQVTKKLFFLNVMPVNTLLKKGGFSIARFL